MLTKTEEPLSNEPVTADFNDTEKAFQEAEKRLDVVKQVMTTLNNQFYPIEYKRIYIEKNFIDIKDDLDLVEKNIRVIKEINSAEVPQNLKLKLEELERGLSMCKRDYEKLSTDFSKEVPSNKNQPPQENTFTSILKKFDQFKQKEGQDLQEKYTSALKESNRALTESTSVLKQLSELEPSSKNYSNYRRWQPVLEKKATDVEKEIEAIQNTDFKGDLKKATSFIVKNRESLEFEKELLKLMLAVDGYPKNIDDKDKPEIKDVKQKAQAVINEILAIKNGNRRPIKGEVPTKDLIEVLKSTNQLFTDPQHANEYKLEAKAQQRKSVGMRVLGALMIALSVAVLAVAITLAATGIGLIAGVAASVLIFGVGVKFYQTEDNKLDLVHAVNKLADTTISWPSSEIEEDSSLGKIVVEEPSSHIEHKAIVQQNTALRAEMISGISATANNASNSGLFKKPFLDAAMALADAQTNLMNLISQDTKDLISKLIAELERMAMPDSDNANSIDNVLDDSSSLVAKLGEELNKNLDLVTTEENQSAVGEVKEKVQKFINNFKGLNSKVNLNQTQNLLKAAQVLVDAISAMVNAAKNGVITPEVLLNINRNITKVNSPEQEVTAAINKFNENVNEPRAEVVKNAAEAFKAAQGLTNRFSAQCRELMSEIKKQFPNVDELLENSKSKSKVISYLSLGFGFEQRGFLTLCSKLFSMIRDELSLPLGKQADQRRLNDKWGAFHASAQELHHSGDTQVNTVDISKPNSEIQLDTVSVEDDDDARRLSSCSL